MRDTRGFILDRLRTAGGILSGQSLSAGLGLSRTAVWKQVRNLRQLGYAIETSAKGYRLTATPDTPLPWEFPGREKTVHYYPEVASTMDIARDLARGGCPSFTVVVADRQTKGRGRLRRQWHSASGGLYFTVVLRPHLPPSLSPRVSCCAALVMALTLQRRYGVPAALKWPNDILVEEVKLAGMLAEMEAEADRITHINIGIGLNVNNDPSRVGVSATSLKKILNRPVSRVRLLRAYLDALEARLALLESAEVMAHWKELSVTLGRRVEIVTQREIVVGKAIDMDDNGSLIVRCDDGARRTVRYGDCFHL
jgi:BirA family biotin operon repressor/biotin-[acetyl-CoA-carboxylase] ligase